jgi:peptide/nickel transport system ATP-binding protein
MPPLLDVQGLTTTFVLDEGVLPAVDDVSFEIGEGETVAIVGESGCGKTIVALSILGLVPLPGRVVDGSVWFDGRDLRQTDPEGLRRVRGTGIGMVFQDPGAALNPVVRIGRQIAEVLRAHRRVTRQEADRAAVRLLGDVGIADPERRARAYPFELSGGMKQRAAIAIATSAGPRLLIADEPTTALDVTVQAEILDLLEDLQARSRMAMLLITHDLGVVAEMARRVLVMYAGRLVERGDAASLLQRPAHPYTAGLTGSVLRLGAGRRAPLGGIPGSVPDLLALPAGCAFHPRCGIADEACARAAPPLAPVEPGRFCACYKARLS